MPDTNDELDPIECSESTSDSGADSDSDSDSGDENEENMLIHNLHYQDPEALVRAFRRNHRGVVGTTFNTVLDFAARNDIRSFIRYIASAEFRRAFLKAFRKHKWKILFLSLGILLMCNPVAIAGFGALGPVAGAFV
jgi:hypothetical protein